ncbi:MAG: TIGR02281 family clan AA aspartic protease [Rhodobiaceae bacterium]|nr:TIGR02281 family clan AA aspartic protease [Rhodobiaceae bacterium]MCC0041096.1 TIGR02281 family clan AA aspartic protease [Rhodobiaceae bacterium]
MSMRAIIGLTVIGGGIAALIVFHESGMIGGLTNDRFAQVVALVAVLILVSGGAFSGRLGKDVRNIAIWLGLALVLVAGYAYRDTLQPIASRITGELVPSRPRAVGNAIELRRGANGHFHAAAHINGTELDMLIDTGASRVSLSQADAQAAGIDMAALRYVAQVNTANGEVFMAPVRLAFVQIGTIRLDDVAGFVAPAGALGGSVIGMSFLERLSGYAVAGDTMTLTP